MANKKANKKFTKEDFISFLKEAVMYYPIPEGKSKDTHCLRPNTFVTLESQNDLDLESFGVDTATESMKGFYFQRSKKNKFPALVLSLSSGDLDNKGRGNKEDCFSFEIGIIDTHTEDCKTNCGYCAKRNETQIQCDTNDMLNAVMEYLELICCARPYKLETKEHEGRKIKTGKKIYPETGEYEWISKPVAEHLLKEGKIDGYEIDRIQTNKLQKSIRENNRKLRKNKWMFPPNYHGTWTTYTICETLLCIDREWNIQEYDKNIKVQCC